jgi:hypothetical protein
MILIEAPSSAYRRGLLAFGHTTFTRGGDLRRCSTKPHHFSWGIDLHARTLYRCILNQAGELLLHRHRPAGPEPFLNAVAPYRTELVVCVEGVFPWHWLADLGAREGLPFVLGHARALKAIPGGTAQNETIDAQTMAVLRRGGLLPQAYVSPAAMRATRDLLRRRVPLTRTRAERLAHVQQTNRQYHRPEFRNQLASKATRDGVAARGLAPAVQQKGAVDRALIDSYAQLLNDVELTRGQTAKQHDAHTRYRRHSVPGLGKLLSVVWRDESPDRTRFPRGQDFVSDGRLVKGAKASAGHRYGTAGANVGHAYLPWAVSDAAVLCLRSPPAGQQDLARVASTPGQGQALPVLAHTLARAVYARRKRDPVFARPQCRQGSWSGAGEPPASRDAPGRSLTSGALMRSRRQRPRRSPSALGP